MFDVVLRNLSDEDVTFLKELYSDKDVTITPSEAEPLGEKPEPVPEKRPSAMSMLFGWLKPGDSSARERQEAAHKEMRENAEPGEPAPAPFSGVASRMKAPTPLAPLGKGPKAYGLRVSGTYLFKQGGPWHGTVLVNGGAADTDSITDAGGRLYVHNLKTNDTVELVITDGHNNTLSIDFGNPGADVADGVFRFTDRGSNRELSFYYP